MTAKTISVRTLQAVDAYAELFFKQTGGSKVKVNRLARQLREMPDLRPDLDRFRDRLADRLEEMGRQHGVQPRELNAFVHDLFAWANIELDGKRVCNVAVF